MAREGIVWLATSNAEIAQARAVLHALSKPGVLDELGFLVLQTAFADRFYPAVNTIMTRARYLVFVPAIYRHLETSALARGKNIDTLARKLQLALRDALLATSPDGGVIGKTSGGDIIRPPANVYWNALAELRIATQRMPESVYQDRLSRGLAGSRSTIDDDDAAHPEDTESLWDPEFHTDGLIVDGGFPKDTTFELKPKEARALQRRYAALGQPDAPSLITWLVEHGTSRGSLPDVMDGPWDAPPPRSVELTSALDHARRLSLFARGVVLQYQRLLIEARRDDDPGIAEAFERWLRKARPELTTWNVQEFVELATRYRGLRARDPAFFTAWLGRMSATRTTDALLNDAEARTIVAGRERAMRGPKARLRSAHHLKTWSPPDSFGSLFHLYYRHGTGSRFARDIVEGLTGKRRA